MIIELNSKIEIFRWCAERLERQVIAIADHLYHHREIAQWNVTGYWRDCACREVVNPEQTNIIQHRFRPVDLALCERCFVGITQHCVINDRVEIINQNDFVDIIDNGSPEDGLRLLRQNDIGRPLGQAVWKKMVEPQAALVWYVWSEKGPLPLPMNLQESAAIVHVTNAMGAGVTRLVIKAPPIEEVVIHALEPA